ncbi:hypothetical protein DK389_28755 [Methylobacterium durans]|uniref:Uncharacterized protein n=1 Tax=Methylobacterium durans TaxID=2202825 RepID=A0A2U8WCB9_9HYPH|nr:hypothetical protein DK389_28755 [Methylobacterium durans]
MKAKSRTVCEVKVDGAWTVATLDEAHSTYRMKPKRCPACHGPVVTYGAYSADRRVSLGHRKGHNGCPLTPKLYSGTPSPHPDALA